MRRKHREDEALLNDPAKEAELEALVAPAHAVFLDAKHDSELIDPEAEDAAELLASTGQDETGLNQLPLIGLDDLIETGSIAEARAKGKARIEGKDYVKQDGDVVEFRFGATSTM